MQKRRYRLKPGAKHYLRGARKESNAFRGGDVIELYPAQAKPILDKLIPLDGDEPTAQKAAVTGPEDEAKPLRLQHLGAGRYNVIHPETGAAINDASLSKAEAEALIAGGDAGGDTD